MIKYLSLFDLSSSFISLNRVSTLNFIGFFFKNYALKIQTLVLNFCFSLIMILEIDFRLSKQWQLLSTISTRTLVWRNLTTTCSLAVTLLGIFLLCQNIIEKLWWEISFLFCCAFIRYQASKDDITVYAALSKPPSSEYVNVSRWYNHIDALLKIS